MAGRKPVSSERKTLIGRRMQIAAEQAGYKNGAEVAEALGVAQPTVSRWWRGERTPEADELSRYAELTNRTPGWFHDAGEQDMEDILAERLMQILDLVQSGLTPSMAFDAATGSHGGLSPRERRKIDAAAPSLRGFLNQKAGAGWEVLPEEEQRRIVDRLAEEARHRAGE